MLLTLGPVSFGLILFINYWVSTQPIWLLDIQVEEKILNTLPIGNKQIINFIEAHGDQLAPSSQKVVCTEFVIKVIDEFEELTADEKNDIRIITTNNLEDLIKGDSSIIKGVQTALVKGGKGFKILSNDDVKPGDFVQFWNIYNGNQYGHCGIVLDVKPNYSLSLYSSHPLSRGYGKQKFLWPDKVFFVRLNITGMK